MIYHKKRPILYVDDTVEQRYAMRRILETEGFLVLEASNGKEALAQIDPSLALVIVDVKLPDVSGYDLARKIKESGSYLPILQVSASYSDPDMRALGLSGGADAYIAQPVHPAEFVAVVRRMIQTSEAEESLRFLATIGPKIISSLSLDETVETIRKAMIPTFADHCEIYLRGYAGQSSLFWPGKQIDDAEHRNELESQSAEKEIKTVNSRKLIAPLSQMDPGFGAISFCIEEDREYTKTDVVLATNIANRVGLALQNCILFASAQSAQSALIQAEKLAMAGRMSAAIAHEINNPLEALVNLIYIIQQSTEASIAIKKTATAALEEVMLLSHITQQSLGFHRELRAPSTIDLSENVRETVELYRKRLSANQISVTFHLDEGVRIRGIKGEIRQVISNLLVNAIEAVKFEGKISITTLTRDDHAVLRIEDNGPGIDEKIKSRIFEPFFTTKHATGTGLGLWVTEAIVRNHGGKLTLTSQQGAHSGTTFDIEFPRLEPFDDVT